MNYKLLLCSIAFVVLVVFGPKGIQRVQSSINGNTTVVLDDPLPSWNEGASKKAIIEFVKRTTKEGSGDFVPVDDRIACFDNDGTLWSEQPMYFQLIFAISVQG